MLELDAIQPRVRLEINLQRLRENFHAIARHVAPLDVTAVLKANAYGLGVRPIAEALAQAGAEGFAVAEINEALPLLDLGKPIQVLGALLPSEIPTAIDCDLILPIGDLERAKIADDYAAKTGKTARCQVPLDTGMGRVGVLYFQADAFFAELHRFKHLEWVGMYSHFPIAYTSAIDFSKEQVFRFLQAEKSARKYGICLKRLHIANSDAVNNLPFTCAAPFTHVRAGINLHGSFDSEGKRNLNLKSILTLKTTLISKRMLPAGYTIGYGCTHTLGRETCVGTISAGYADGLPLALSNRGYVLIHGKPCPILGRISMDYTTIDLGQVPEAELGDEVICLGGEGIHAIGVEQWAALKNTHPYEIICSFGNRVKRTYTH